MKLLGLLVLLFSTSVLAKELTESMVIKSYGLDNTTGLYRLNVKNKAGVYLATKNHLECLDSSIKHQKPVKIVFDVTNLKVKGCEIEKTGQTQKTNK